jgi:hypothetical protein
MSFNDKPGIPILGGYKLGTSDPMDVRTVAEDEIDLQSLIDNGAVYEGLEVYVKSLGIKKVYNGTEFVEIETGSNVEIHVEDDTLVINTNGTSSGSSGGSSDKELSIAAELPISSEKNEVNISSVLQTLCDKLDKSKKYYLGFKFTTELNFGMTYSATTTNGVVITANKSASLGWVANIISANSSCLVSAPEGIVTPASFIVVNHIMTWGGTLGCTASASIRKLDNTVALDISGTELTSRISKHSVVITAHEIEEA